MNILIMESNEANIDILSFMLMDNFDIKTVENDKKAIDELKRNKYDIFLMGSTTSLDPKSEIEFIKNIYVPAINIQMKIVVMDDKKNIFRTQALLGAGADVVVEKFPLRNVVDAVKNIAVTISISS